MNNTIRDRCARSAYDAVVIGAGANGLAAAITLALAGRTVVLLEGSAVVGGACGSAELTLPGFVHDIGSAIHPLGAGSPFFRTLPLERHGLEWVHSSAPLAHPIDSGPDAGTVILERSVEATAAGMGPRDGDAYHELLAPLLHDGGLPVETISRLLLLTDVPSPGDLAHLPLGGIARMARYAALSATSASQALFTGPRAAALFAGLAAHSFMPLGQAPSAGIALALALSGHAFGWPFPRGGAQRLSDALAAHFRDLGGEIVLDARVGSLKDLPESRAVLCDITPRQLLELGGGDLPSEYARKLGRFRYGPAAFKIDYALSGPIPWRDDVAEACARAATVHLGGTMEEIAASEATVGRGGLPAKPYVLLAQHTPFDPTRAPAGAHTAWAYCHLPHGSTADMTEPLESQIERFAPGFRKRILARSVLSPRGLEAINPNLVGGDISGGRLNWHQLLFRPAVQAIPYTTPVAGLYLCSSSTPPGPGVHGMCGYYAARLALSRG